MSKADWTNVHIKEDIIINIPPESSPRALMTAHFANQVAGVILSCRTDAVDMPFEQLTIGEVH